jgi:hypothetical protein
MQLKTAKQRRLAIIAQSLYLANLLLVPGLAFLALLYVFIKQSPAYGLARIHLFRAVQLSLFSGLLLVAIPLLVLKFSQQLDISVMMLLLYFVTFHAAVVLLGMFNLARAMSGRLPIF